MSAKEWRREWESGREASEGGGGGGKKYHSHTLPRPLSLTLHILQIQDGGETLERDKPSLAIAHQENRLQDTSFLANYGFDS